MTHPNSESATSATKSTLSEESLRAINSRLAHQGGEMPASLLVVLVLVEGGAGGREKNRVAGSGELGRAFDGPVHSPGPLDRNDAGESRLDQSGGLADREHFPRRAGDGRRERFEIAVLVAPSQN